MAHRAHLPPLNGLRALLCLWMVAFHALFFMFGFTHNEPLATLAEHPLLSVLSFGFLPVDGFFVLTGTLIARPLLAALGRERPPSLVALYSRRFVRIVPTLALCLGAYALLVFPNGSMSAASVKSEASLELRERFFPGKEWWPHQCEHGKWALNLLWANAQLPFGGCAAWTWTLSVQGSFYIAFPLLLVTLCWPRPPLLGGEVARQVGAVQPSRCACRCCFQSLERCAPTSAAAARRRVRSFVTLAIVASTAARVVAWASLAATLEEPGALEGEAKWRSLFLAFFFYSHTATRVGTLFVGVGVASVLDDYRVRCEHKLVVVDERDTLMAAASIQSGVVLTEDGMEGEPGLRRRRPTPAAKVREGHKIDWDDDDDDDDDDNEPPSDDNCVSKDKALAGTAPSLLWPSDGLTPRSARAAWLLVAMLLATQLLWTKVVVGGAVFETPGWSAARSRGAHNATFFVLLLVGGPLSGAIFAALVVLAVLPFRKERCGEGGGPGAALRLTALYRRFLAAACWTPLADASFGAYLLHPMIMQYCYAAGRPFAFNDGAPPSARAVLLYYAPAMQLLAFTGGWVLHFGFELPIARGVRRCVANRSCAGRACGAVAAIHATVASLLLIAQHGVMAVGVAKAFHGEK